MAEETDLLIVGAGPAGMSAAITAAELGLNCLVADEKPAPGGQIYAGAARAIEDGGIFGPDYARGAGLIARFRASRVYHLPNATVWNIAADGTAHLSAGRASKPVRAKRIIVATGAVERPFPIRGWTLPGVLTAGGAQLLLKTTGLVPSEPVVLAGSGPLLLLLANQYLRAGVPVEALLDTTPRGNLWRALAHLPAALGPGSVAYKGLALLRNLRKAGVRVVRDVRSLEASGADRLEAVSWTAAGGEAGRLPARVLALHRGIVPETHLLRALGLRHAWDAPGQHWKPVGGIFGETASPVIAVAGDCAGIDGAMAAESKGALAALDAARLIGRIDQGDRDRRAGPWLDRLRAELRARPFVDRLFAPDRRFAARAPDDLVICRCEEVTAGAMRHEARRGVRDIDRLKTLLRCGMGPCQGRMCERTTAEILAGARGVDPREIGQLRIRAPVKPVGIEELIGLGAEELPETARIPTSAPAATERHHGA